MFFNKPKRKITSIFLHCTASDSPSHDDVSVIQDWHLQRGFNDIGYHYLINKNGNIQTGRDIEKTPAAQRGHNANSIAICLHGLKDFTEAQFESLRMLCNQINDYYDKRIIIRGHKEVSNKSCPVVDYKKILNLNSKGFVINNFQDNILLNFFYQYLKDFVLDFKMFVYA